MGVSRNSVDRHPPDGPPTLEFTMFPTVYDIPFHYDNPVTGRRTLGRADPALKTSTDTGVPADIAAALRFLNQVQKKKAVVFLISDFMDQDYLRELRVTARKHDVICCPLSDPREFDLVDAGLLEVQDPGVAGCSSHLAAC